MDWTDMGKIEDALKELAKKKRPSHNPGQRDDGIKRQTLYLPEPVHKVLKDAAYTLEIPQQELYRQALDLWLKKHKFPGIEEIVEENS